MCEEITGRSYVKTFPGRNALLVIGERAGGVREGWYVALIRGRSFSKGRFLAPVQKQKQKSQQAHSGE